MKARVPFALALSIIALAPAAEAQAVQGQAQGTATFPPNPAYQPTPAYNPPPAPIENIGRPGQFIFGIERVTGLFFDRQAVTYNDPATGTDRKLTFKSTSLGLLGLDSNSPSALPRFALDYDLYEGLTVGGSVMLSTRALSVSGSGQDSGAPPTANDDGLTLLGAARVGYAYAFDSTFAIWPRVGLSYVLESSRSEVVDPGTGKSLGTWEYKSNLGELNVEALFAVSPIEHIVLTAGPYLDLGLGGSYSVLQESTETDHRDANLTSFGLLINASGYY